MSGRPFLIIFARAPIPGRAKTRLIPRLGAEGAVHLQFFLLKLLASRFKAMREMDVRIDFTPDTAGYFFRRLGFSIAPQGPGDLGRRMARSLGRALADGAGQAILVGSDIPDLSRDIVCEAIKKLRTVDLVFGPAEDGGFYLVGAGRRIGRSVRRLERIFMGVPWSSASALTATEENARRMGIITGRIKTLSDLDTPEDLDRLMPGVGGQPTNTRSPVSRSPSAFRP